MVADARKLLQELEKENKVYIYGTENIPKDTGCLLVFNHPNMDVLLQAMLKLIVVINETTGQQARLAMGSEIPMTTSNFNDKSAVPGSIWLLKHFHRLYSENIISVPTAETRKDYLTGRAGAVRRIMKAIQEKDVMMISPEGHVEINNEISPVDSYHDGSGKLALLAARMGIPTVPVAIWGEAKGEVNVNIGKPFMMEGGDPNMAAVRAMSEIARCMPEELRGPFR